MGRLILLSAVFGFGLIIQGCAVYPYDASVAYYGYGPHYGFNYGYRPYGHSGWVAEAIADEDMVGVEMKLCSKIIYLIRSKWMGNNPIKDYASSL